MRTFWRLAYTMFLGAGVFALPVRAQDPFGDFRALWVSRFEYSMTNPGNVETIISNAASMGITDVLFQVRGKADAYYAGNVEPRAERLNGVWDPLQTAIDAGQVNGVRIHAWLNSMPIWRGTAAPQDAAHAFFQTDPSLRRFDTNGTPENPLSPNGEYASANPILAETHDHINSVVDDILANYEVAGVHLDYIRWIGSQNFNTLPHDDPSHQMFEQATGLDASNPANAVAYRSFIKNRITDLVSSIGEAVDAAESQLGRTIDLSAAVWRDPDIAENERLQDYRTWLENDLLDIVMPMMYLNSNTDHFFLPNLNNTLLIPTNTRVAPGLGVYLHTETGGGVDLTVEQLDRLHDFSADGATFFSYGSFFGSDPLAAERRTAVVEYYDALNGGNGGPGNVIDDFEFDEGRFGWSPTFSAQTTGVLAGSTIERVTTEAYLGSASQEIHIVGDPSGWTLRHASGIGSSNQAAAPSGNEPLETTGYVGFWLKTLDPGVTVQIAVDDPGSADRGFAQSVIADGQWHLYEWDFENDGQWEGWVTGDGVISGAATTIDSIFFYGSGDATLYLDAVSHNPNGRLASTLTGDYNGDGSVDGGDLAAWEAAFGTSGSSADGNGDGVVDGADLLILQRQWGAGSGAAASAIPEPASIGLLAFYCVAATAWSAAFNRSKR